MRPKLPIPPPRFGRTAAIAGAILAAVAVFQLGSVTLAFLRKPKTDAAQNGDEGGHLPPMKIDVSKLVAESPPPDDPASLGTDPLLGANDARPPGPQPILPHAEPLVPPGENGAPEMRITAPPRPTPVPLEVFTPKSDPRFGELIEQGKLLRNSGDTAGALVKFREAAVIEPANALAIAEQAFTFEKMTLPEKAAEQWKRIIVMGDRAGLYYSVAQSKLHAAVQESMRVPGSPGGSPASGGKALVIGEIKLDDDADPASAKKFTLSVSVNARESEAISVRDTKLAVLFYERANGKDIVKTVANVSNRWVSSPVDWKDGEAETLEVSYDLPALQARTERRQYYGYIVRVYYRGELQDSRAEPAGLSQKFPASSTASE